MQHKVSVSQSDIIWFYLKYMNLLNQEWICCCVVGTINFILSRTNELSRMEIKCGRTFKNCGDVWRTMNPKRAIVWVRISSIQFGFTRCWTLCFRNWWISTRFFVWIKNKRWWTGKGVQYSIVTSQETWTGWWMRKKICINK